MKIREPKTDAEREGCPNKLKQPKLGNRSSGALHRSIISGPAARITHSGYSGSSHLYEESCLPDQPPIVRSSTKE